MGGGRPPSSPPSGRSRPGGGGILAVAALLLALATGAEAAAPTWDEPLYNPKPDKEDVILPLPCGGAMVFRKVVVASDGLYSDQRVTLGSGDDSHGYIEGSHPAYISGSFADTRSNQRYFLIGKYEVNEAQFEAVTQPACGDKPGLPKRLPKGGLSWIDATSFADRYTQWLRKSAPDALPREEQEPGFVRLPTEEEWEYAARGGTRVSPAEFTDATFPMPDGLNRYAWFSGAQSANGRPQLTGLLQPNPLGLYDILGNLDEIVFEPFHLNRLDRAHGQAGGFIVRGGNFTTDGKDIRSAYRQEVPYYDGDGPRRSRTTGLRLVVAAPVVTSPARARALQTAWGKLGSVSAAAAAPASPSQTLSDDPLEMLGQLAKTSQDPVLRGKLQAAQIALRGNIASRDEARDRAAKAALRLGAFLGHKLSEDSRWIAKVSEMIDKRVKAGEGSDPRLVQSQQKLTHDQAVMDGNLRYYSDTVITTSEDYAEEVLTRQRGVLDAELRGMGLGDLMPYVDRYLKHVAQYRTDKRVARSQWLNDWATMK